MATPVNLEVESPLPKRVLQFACVIEPEPRGDIPEDIHYIVRNIPKEGVFRRHQRGIEYDAVLLEWKNGSPLTISSASSELIRCSSSSSDSDQMRVPATVTRRHKSPQFCGEPSQRPLVRHFSR
jgi:hypothetical protein